MSNNIKNREYTGLEIAVIGLAGKFPGAEDVDQYWENLINGKESITFFTDTQLLEAGLPKADFEAPNYVKASGTITNIESFDYDFFGYTPFEANLMDPQMRLFHEYAWKALENAGYTKANSANNIGIYGGASSNDYWRYLGVISNARKTVGEWAASQLNNKDYLCQRVAYKLNLKGPSLTLQTACSTSLVAVHVACQSLLNYDCNIALAGGVCITFPSIPEPGDTLLLLAQEKGYNYQEGMIMSADGHCKTFDAEATGTVPGSGIGIVALKRLADAIKDNDNIYAVITGSAINNDGKNKVGFTAPGIDGQTEVIKAALNISEVESESITYVEAHGTGTSLGDPIELEALKIAFETDKKGYCAIGSVKSNIGHLDTAAGIAGFIKTVLALKHKQIPPSLHFKNPNPKIDFENSPFYVSTKTKNWENNDQPLRAGVSSFGIGGTNAHVILEEAPQKTECVKNRRWELLSFSAKTENSLTKTSEKVINYFEKHKNINLADVAYTLKVGRETFPHRKFMICSDINEAIEKYKNSEYQTLEVQDDKHIVFLFSGQGSQYINMGKKIYEEEPLFRKELDNCFEIAKQLVNIDFQAIIFPDEKFERTAQEQINNTQYTQPLLFMFEYALARFTMHLGIQPYAMMGHSIGEYVAACLAGVLSLKDALELVIIRGKLMQSVPEGAMLSAVMSEGDAQKYISNEIEVAAINSPTNVVFSGTIDAIEDLIKEFDRHEILHKRLHTSHAFHSKMMNGILDAFEGKVSQISLNPPKIPFISNISGDWIKNDEATSPAYWTKHLRYTVLFSKGITKLNSIEKALFLEIGPGNSLTTLTNQHFPISERNKTLNLIKHPQEKVDETYYFLNKLGQLWLHGINVNWIKYYEGENRNRISLPTYEFEQKRCWDIFDSIKEYMTSGPKLIKSESIANWFYSPVWRRDDLLTVNKTLTEKTKWLIFSDNLGYGTSISEYLIKENHEVILVGIQEEFEKKDGNNYLINPSKPEHYNLLFSELKKASWIPSKIIHLWNLTADNYAVENTHIIDGLDVSFFSVLFIAKEIEKQNFSNKISFFAISNHIQEVTGDEVINPLKATIQGIIRVIPQEIPNIDCVSIDVKLPSDKRHESQLTSQLINELFAEHYDKVVAYRAKFRWVLGYNYCKMPEVANASSKLKMNGVYLITGGLGNLGLVVAEFLAKSVKAKLVLTTRSNFPDKKDWNNWLSDHNPEDNISKKIKQLLEIENIGGEIIVKTADVANEQQMGKVITEAEQSFKPINGIIHIAGMTSGKSFSFINKLKKDDCFEQFNAKISGTLALSKIIENKNLDFCILFSSISSVLGGLGFSAYASANAYMDYFVCQLNRTSSTPWISINWDGWNTSDEKVSPPSDSNKNELTIRKSKGFKALSYVFAFETINQLIVSTGNINLRIKKWVNLISIKEEKENTPVIKINNSKPSLSNKYLAPETLIEKSLAKIWERILGYNQIGTEDDFYELGGDSLKAITISSSIQKELKVNFPLSEFLIRANIKKIANFIESLNDPQEPEVESTNRVDLIQKGKNRIMSKKNLIRD